MDTLGLIWALVVTAASVQDRDGALLLLRQLQGLEETLRALCADASYRGGLEKLVEYLCGWKLQIVEKLAQQKGFVVLPKRWIVERTLAWMGKWRRLSKDYEFQPKSSEAMIYWAAIGRMLRKLTVT